MGQGVFPLVLKRKYTEVGRQMGPTILVLPRWVGVGKWTNCSKKGTVKSDYTYFRQDFESNGGN